MNCFDIQLWVGGLVGICIMSNYTGCEGGLCDWDGEYGAYAPLWARGGIVIMYGLS